MRSARPDDRDAAVPGTEPGITEHPLFGVPAGTLLRFATLILLVIGTTGVIHTLFASVVVRRRGTSLASARCQVQNNLYLLADNWVDPDDTKWQGYWHCTRHQTTPILGWALAALSLLLLLTMALYWLQPAWRIRRRRLVPLDLWSDPALGGELAALVARAGIAHPPRFITDPLSRHSGAVVFGGHRDRVVCLDAGLVALRTRAPDSFRAVVLHELAHLRNRDVTITHATLALWRAFVVVGLLPFLLVRADPTLLSGHPFTAPTWNAATFDLALSTAWRVLVLAALVYVSRASVLRAREHYADARVARWTGTPDPYGGLAATGAEGRWWRAAWAKHPSRPARDAALARPHLLLRPGIGEALAGGLALQLAWGHLRRVLLDAGLVRADNGWFTAMQIAWSVAVTALLVVAGWRHAAFRRAGGETLRGPALTGLALGLGLVAGRFLDVMTSAGQRSLPTNGIGVADALLLLAFSVGLASWTAYLVRLLGDRVRSWYGLLSAAAVTLVCLVSMGRWTQEGGTDGLLRQYLQPESRLLRTYVAQTAWTSWDSAVTHLVVFAFLQNVHRILVIIAVTALWLLPLLLLAPPWRRIRSALLAGAAGAALWAVLDLLLRWAARGDLTAAVRGGEGFAVIFASWEIATLVAVQFAIALVAGRRGTGLPIVLLACAVTGVAGTLALWGLHTADGCGAALWSVSRTACTPSIGDALAARPPQVVPVLGTALALAGAALGQGSRKLRPRRAVTRKPGSPGPGSPTPETRAPGTPSSALARRAVPLMVGVACLAVTVSTPSATRDVFKMAEVSRTTPVRDGTQMLNIWVYGGGFDKFLLLSRTMDWMFKDKAERCGPLASVVVETRRFPPPPEPRAAALWQSGLDNLERGARQCVEALQRHDDALMLESATSYLASIKSRGELLTLLTKAASASP